MGRVLKLASKIKQVQKVSSLSCLDGRDFACLVCSSLSSSFLFAPRHHSSLKSSRRAQDVILRLLPAVGAWAAEVGAAPLRVLSRLAVLGLFLQMRAFLRFWVDTGVCLVYVRFMWHFFRVLQDSMY